VADNKEWLMERISTVREWAKASLIAKPGNVVRGEKLYRDYITWAQRRSVGEASKTVWGTYMGKHYNRSRYSGVSVYRDIELNPGTPGVRNLGHGGLTQ